MNERTILIAGGTSGIGLATAELVLKQGCRAIIVGRESERLQSSYNNLVGAGFQPESIEMHQLDLQDVDRIKEVVPRLKLLQKGLFGLVCNAAAEILKPVIEFSPEDLDRTWRVNILAPILLIQACYPFLKQRGGSIVYVGSTADTRCDATYSVYGGSKAFMRRFVGHAAQEFGFDGVRINVVSPGATDTPLLQEFIARGQWSNEHLESFRSTIPIEQRFATSGEVAEAVWFALNGPKYFHGEELRIDGGQR